MSSDYGICRIRIVYCFIERDRLKAMLEPVGWSPEINHISGHCIINRFTLNWAVLHIREVLYCFGHLDFLEVMCKFIYRHRVAMVAVSPLLWLSYLSIYSDLWFSLYCIPNIGGS